MSWIEGGHSTAFTRMELSADDLQPCPELAEKVEAFLLDWENKVRAAVEQKQQGALILKSF